MIPHACSLFLIGLVVGYVVRGALDAIDKAIKMEY
jgi:hypothetical protein